MAKLMLKKPGKPKGVKLNIGQPANGVQVKRTTFKQTVVIGGILYLLVILLTLHASAYMARDYQRDFMSALSLAAQALTKHPFQFVAVPTGCAPYIALATAIYFLVALYMYAEVKKDEHTMGNSAYGSSHFNADIDGYNKRYTDPPEKVSKESQNNLILTQDVYLSMNTRMTRRNMNTIVIGGSGAGKSRFYVKPNICQMPYNTSFVVTDPSGEMLESMGVMLEDFGYKLKILNLVNMDKSNRYNPLKYINCENDVILLTDCILTNTADPNKTGGDDFWEKAMKLMLQSFIFLLWLHGDEIGYSKSFDSVMKLMRGCTISEEASSTTDLSDTDKLFNMIEFGYKEEDDGTGKKKIIAGSKLTEGDPNYVKAYGEDIAVKQYKNFKMGAGKTLKNILISAMARFSNFDSQQLIDLTSVDDIELNKIGDEKTALFVILPQEHDSFNFLAAILYSQMFQSLYFHAENECQGNYIVKDKSGEIIKVFEIDHSVKAEKAKAESADIEEIEININKLTEKAPKKSVKDKWKEKRAEKKAEKEKKKKEKQRENEIWDADAEKNEAETLPDESPGSYDDTNVEKKAKDYIEALKHSRLTKKGNDYFIKINVNGEEEVVASYKNEDYAIKRITDMKSAYIDRCGLGLPYHVRFMLDEFANIGQIPRFTNLLATMRKYGISCAVILQSISQIKKMYKDDWGSIIGNCDEFLFLGCPEYDTLEYVSKKLGKTTIIVRNNSRSIGAKSSTSMSYQHVARDLMSPDELGQMDEDECVLLIRGVYPFRGKKYDYEKHPNYKYTGDADSSKKYKISVKKREEEHGPRHNVPIVSYEESAGLTESNRKKQGGKPSGVSQSRVPTGSRGQYLKSSKIQPPRQSQSGRIQEGHDSIMNNIMSDPGKLLTKERQEMAASSLQKARMATEKDIDQLFGGASEVKIIAASEFLLDFAETYAPEGDIERSGDAGNGLESSSAARQSEAPVRHGVDSIIDSPPSISSSIERL